MSQTQTFHRSVVNPTRNHDYLYDNTYTLSSERDHARTIYKTQVGVDRVKRVPQQAEMFSALPHFPRFQVQLEQTDPVPSHVNRRWRGFAEQRREALVRYTTFNYDPSVQVPAKTYENAKVTGVNRYKYFRRPIIPFLQQVPPEVLLQPTAVDPLAPPAEIAQRPPTPLTRTVELQTDYRDSEAQTEPYTPEYVVRPGSAPEILTLATLSYKRGLPAGLAEVEMIERARAKRAWERTLPALSDVTQLDRRKRMMDEMETKEWAVREDEIAKLQEARLEVLKRLLVEREQKQQDLNDKRLDKLWLKKQKRKEKRTETIRKHHIQCVRKLLKKRAGADGKLQRRDVVGDYGGFGSQTHAPLTRIGVFLDRGSEQYVVKSKYLDTFQGLLDLEQSLPSVAIRPQFKAPKRNLVSRGYVMRGLRLETELKDIHEAMKLEHLRGKVPSKPLRFLHKVEKPIPRPPTPRVPVPSQEEEEREQAVIVLQKVIRGRAMQNMMYEGKGERSELIDEVRSTHALQKAQQQLKRQDKQRVVTLQRQRRLYQHKSAFVDEALSRLEGKPIGDLLDFLSKELIRLEEERRIHAYSMLAERRRRIREAEESGRRQVEERRRREEDEIFKQLVKIHQQTVDTYLEDCILHAVDATADEQAREEIRQQADQINDLAYEVEANRTRLQSEEIVSELVHSFLLPEIMKIDSRQKIKLDQRKHLLAAHRIIHATTEPIIESAGDDVIDAPEFATGSDPAPGDVTAADDGTAEDDVTRDEVKGAVEEVTSEQLVVAQVFEDEPEFTEEVLQMSSAPEEEYMEAELMEDEEEVVALEVPPDVPAEDVIIAEPKVVIEPEVADHVIVAQPEIIAQQEVAIDEIAAPEVDDVTTERVAEPDVKADDVIVEEPEAVVKQLEPEAAADDVTAEQPDAADDVTAEKPEALVDDVTTEQPEAAADDVTTEQQEVTAQDVTAEQPDAADDVTAEQPEAAIDDVTAEKPEAAVDDVTTEQPEATVQDVITDQSEDAVDDVTEKLETE